MARKKSDVKLDDRAADRANDKSNNPSSNERGLTRRQALAVGVVGAAAGLAAMPALAKRRSAGGPMAKQESNSVAMAQSRMPVVFLPHGGGPWPFVDLGISQAEYDGLANYLRALRDLPVQKPKALLVISAHWEAPVPTVMSSAQPPMLYDYYGFPPESYKITWPAPGNPALAARVRTLLSAAGFATAEDKERGYDHGTFVPLKLTYPDADIPVVQLSLIAGLDPAEHLRMGRALAPLRDEGVLILGSGMTFHNLRAFRDPRAHEPAQAFDAWLQEATDSVSAVRNKRLEEWTSAPYARLVHPREEHLIPLMVIAGAAGEDQGQTTWSGTFMGLKLSGYHFG